VTIGRPTCSVHDCSTPLKSVKHRYCPIHADQDKICVVTTCSDAAEETHRTCSHPEHRRLESYNDLRNKAMFQLKHRLARLKTSQPQASLPEVGTTEHAATPFNDEEVVLDEDGTEVTEECCDGKPDEGNNKLRARFGRKRTHNEELAVASCGVILGRATFYGSEAPNGVRVGGFFDYIPLEHWLIRFLDILDAAFPHKEVSAWCFVV